MNQVTIGKLHRSIPSTWDELSASQLIEAAHLFSQGLKLFEFKTRLLFAFLNIPKKIFLSIDPSEIWGLTNTLEFILGAVTLSRNPIRTLKAGRLRTYYGPDDGLSNCTFGEFIKVQKGIQDYAASSDPKDLNAIIAVIYRPKKYFWFIRKRFSPSADPRRRLVDRFIDPRAKQFSKTPHSQKFAVYLMLTGVLNSLPEKFPNVYRKKGSNHSQSVGWAGVIISLADGKTDDQSLDTVMNSNMYNVFLGLEQKSIEYFEFMRNNPSND